uniref:Uncharacterized protein n=1 Tax=Glossina palpalis gambiensis TaxID=67801 RepID=A0A1B0AQE2_9MUSC
MKGFLDVGKEPQINLSNLKEDNNFPVIFCESKDSFAKESDKISERTFSYEKLKNKNMQSFEQMLIHNSGPSLDLYHFFRILKCRHQSSHNIPTLYSTFGLGAEFLGYEGVQKTLFQEADSEMNLVKIIQNLTLIRRVVRQWKLYTAYFNKPNVLCGFECKSKTILVGSGKLFAFARQRNNTHISAGERTSPALCILGPARTCADACSSLTNCFFLHKNQQMCNSAN